MQDDESTVYDDVAPTNRESCHKLQYAKAIKLHRNDVATPSFEDTVKKCR